MFSQVKKPDTVFCDCQSAIDIKLSSKAKYGKTIAPLSSGNFQEISPAKQKTKFAFEKEHHSAWYKLTILSNGLLTFDITPIKSDDDYDFMLFKDSSTLFCDSLLANKKTPIRACISRDKEELKGKTGLSFKAISPFVKNGIGSAYCNPIDVKKGEVYYLVLDNVYKKGEGHLIEFFISQNTDIIGTITDENKKPIKAEITLTNSKGDTVMTHESDTDGSYHFTAPIILSEQYVLNFYNDSCFTFSQIVLGADISKTKTLKQILLKLRKGKKHSVGAINFVGDSPEYIPQAVPAINNLYRLLLKNPNLKIEIIGHTNGCSNSLSLFKAYGVNSQGLSELRATTIVKELVLKGIDPDRIKSSGKGCIEMIFKNPKSDYEGQQNRRVEIMVLNY